jgi:hypothetical protein
MVEEVRKKRGKNEKEKRREKEGEEQRRSKKEEGESGQSVGFLGDAFIRVSKGSKREREAEE